MTILARESIHDCRGKGKDRRLIPFMRRDPPIPRATKNKEKFDLELVHSALALDCAFNHGRNILRMGKDN